MTENQIKAFGFAGKSLLWDEIGLILNALQEREFLYAISSSTQGEDRVHACGRVDGINLVLSTFNTLREEARVKNGLTPKEDLS